MNYTLEAGDKTVHSDPERIYLFNDLTYIDCEAQFSDCSVLKNVGAIFSLLLFPTISLGLSGNLILLLFILFNRNQGISREHSITKFVITIAELFFIISNVVLIDFTKYSLSWFDLKGSYLESWTFGCKLSSFFKQFAQSLFSNLMLCDTLFILSGYFLTTVGKKPSTPLVYGLTMTLIISFVHACPSFVLNNVWQIVETYEVCAANPRWPNPLLYWAEVHNVLFCEGLLQCLVVIPLLLFIGLAYKNYSNAMQIVATFSNNSNGSKSFSLFQRVLRSMNEQQKDVLITSVKFLLLSVIKICRSVVQSLLFQKFHVSFRNKIPSKTINDLYVFIPLLDFLEVVMFMTIVLFTWIDLLRMNAFPKILMIMGFNARFYKSSIRRFFLLDQYYQEIEEAELVRILKSSLSPRKLELVEKEKECYLNELYYRNLHDETPVLHARKWTLKFPKNHSRWDSSHSSFPRRELLTCFSKKLAAIYMASSKIEWYKSGYQCLTKYSFFVWKYVCVFQPVYNFGFGTLKIQHFPLVPILVGWILNEVALKCYSLRTVTFSSWYWTLFKGETIV